MFTSLPRRETPLIAGAWRRRITAALVAVTGGVLAWGFMVPLLIFFLGPQLQAFLPAGSTDGSWISLINGVWRYIVRPIAVGGMMTGAARPVDGEVAAVDGGVSLSVSAAGDEEGCRPVPERSVAGRGVMVGVSSKPGGRWTPATRLS